MKKFDIRITSDVMDDIEDVFWSGGSEHRLTLEAKGVTDGTSILECRMADSDMSLFDLSDIDTIVRLLVRRGGGEFKTCHLTVTARQSPDE